MKFDLKSKTKRIVKLKKDYIPNFTLTDIENNNAGKKKNYMNINKFDIKLKHKNMIDEKYKELNSLVSNLQNTTNEILSKKEDK